jgi:putative ABC transport system permease protein
MRTVLCILSLSIGVAAVTTITSLGRGARAAVQERIAQAGTNMIVVSAGNWTSGGVRFGTGSSSTLVNVDAEAIARQVRGVAYVSPGVRTRQQLVNGRLNWSANVEGVGADVEAASEVCVIGVAVRDALFEPGTAAVGRQIRVGLQVFRVIGVLSPKGQSAGGQDQDDAVFVPYTTA